MRFPDWRGSARVLGTKELHAKIHLLALAVAVTVVVGACSSSGGSGGGLTGKTWQLTAITEKTPAFQGVVPAADQSKYTIVFNSDSTFNATADCNVVGGSYATSGSSSITITPGPSTLVFCGEGSLGDLYTHALSTATSYAIANDTLTLTLKDGGTLTFAAGTAPAASAAAPSATTAPSTAPGASPAAGLTGKAWQLTAVTEKVPAFQGVVPDAEQANYTIEFKTDGSFQAKADCNQVAGTYSTTSSGGMTLVLGPSTMAACAEGSLADLYVLGLSNASSYAIEGGQLTITLAEGGTLVFK